MSKVYCKDCKYYEYVTYLFGFSKEIIHQCHAPFNLLEYPAFISHTPIKKKKVDKTIIHKDNCKEINKNNNCKHYTQKRKSWWKWWC